MFPAHRILSFQTRTLSYAILVPLAGVWFCSEWHEEEQVEIWGTPDKIRSEDPNPQNAEELRPTGESKALRLATFVKYDK